MDSALDTGNTAWVLTSAALVLIMIPGLAFFYGGMNRAKSVLNMIMMVMGALFVVAILWVAFGYSVAFGTQGDEPGKFFGSFTEYAWLNGLMADDPSKSLPAMAFVAFQMLFACITVGLIAGALADRVKYWVWMVFAGIWATLVYFPVAHWVWGGGWIAELGNVAEGGTVHVIDFAGGTAVHINAGAAALALAIVAGRRIGWMKTPMKPHNLPLVMIGAALLWFGWFGFNAGSELAADNTASVVFVNTIIATCAAALAWLLVEKIRDGHATSLGAASGVVAGLVAITPSCSAVGPIGAIIIGVVAGAICALAVGLKYKLKYDDSFDVVGVHLVGGVIGTLMIGLIAVPEAPAGVTGLFAGGGLAQFQVQFVAAAVVLVYSLVVALIIGFALKAVSGFRVSDDDEVGGIDLAVHGESAYEFGDSGAGGHFAGVGAAAVRHSEEA
jgi:Amt family ammonium transporter